jgi:hypothetical protein
MYKVNGLKSSYWVSSTLDVICAHLVGSWSPLHVLEHLLQQSFQLGLRDGAIDLAGWVMGPAILTIGMNMLYQGDD